MSAPRTHVFCAFATALVLAFSGIALAGNSWDGGGNDNHGNFDDARASAASLSSSTPTQSNITNEIFSADGFAVNSVSNGFNFGSEHLLTLSLNTHSLAELRVMKIP